MAKKKTGRPLKLNEKIKIGDNEMTRAERLIDLIRLGLTKESAARKAGLGESTLMEYLAHGRADMKAGRVTVFSDFLDASTCALDDFEIASLVTIRRADDWRATWELLQARLPEKWGKRTRITIETARAEAAEVAVTAFTDALQEHIADPTLRLRILETALDSLAAGDSAQKALGVGQAA